jgi:hypothetical protein
MLLAGLTLWLAPAAACLAATAADEIEIVDDPHPAASDGIDLGRRFGDTACPSPPPRRTILEASSPDARRILIHHFDGRDWPDVEAVKVYVRRLLQAEPEGGRLSPGVYWAEMRPAEVLASVEFADGHRRPLHIANGYAHAQDGAGCEWWARYLGPDRRTWIVWP